MKHFKRIYIILLAVIVTVMSFTTTTAFAAEIYPEQLLSSTAENIEKEYSARTVRVLVNEEATISTTHSVAGTPFVFQETRLIFDVDYTPSSGTVVAVRLHDQTTGEVREWQSSNGTIVQSVYLTPGHSYIFEYLLASGSGSLTLTNHAYEE